MHAPASLEDVEGFAGAMAKTSHTTPRALFV